MLALACGGGDHSGDSETATAGEPINTDQSTPQDTPRPTPSPQPPTPFVEIFVDQTGNCLETDMQEIQLPRHSPLQFRKRQGQSFDCTLHFTCPPDQDECVFNPPGNAITELHLPLNSSVSTVWMGAEEGRITYDITSEDDLVGCIQPVWPKVIIVDDEGGEVGAGDGSTPPSNGG
jgi:hypothetical protein